MQEPPYRGLPDGSRAVLFFCYNLLEKERSLLDISELSEVIGASPEIDQEIVDQLRFDEELSVPWELTDAEVWANYTNDKLYVIDKKLREYFKRMRWTRERKGGMKTAVPLVFVQLFGRKATPADSGTCQILHRLMRYYCTRYTGTTTIGGKRFAHAYFFSKYSTAHKRPYSLRLRLEDCNARGVGRVFAPRNTADKKGPEGWKTRRGDRVNGDYAYGRRCDNC